MTQGTPQTMQAAAVDQFGGEIMPQTLPVPALRPQPKARAGVQVNKYNYDGMPTAQTIQKLNQLIEAGPFEVHVARIFPLDQAADAQRALSEHYLGKLALKPNG